MKTESFGLTDVGCRREKNEDHFLVREDLQLFVVADGMGGHVGGERASRLAVETIQDSISQLTVDPDATFPESIAVRPGDYKCWLEYALSSANMRIFDAATKDTRLSGMGTTTVAALFRKNKIFLANVGDSRIYRIRKGKIEQLTHDHSLVGEQIRAGMIQPKEAKDHRLKNIITRSVGFQADVEVDVDAKAAKNDDVYVLCSDGLYNLVEDDEMLKVAQMQEKLSDICRHLIDIAKARGGDDNITVIAIRILSLEESDDEEESTVQL